MNSNGREVEFRKIGVAVEMWVERDCAPFEDYLCGILRRDGEEFYRFHPSPSVVMHCKLLREVAAEVARLNA